jgi:hypothetical protein
MFSVTSLVHCREANVHQSLSSGHEVLGPHGSALIKHFATHTLAGVVRSVAAWHAHVEVVTGYWICRGPSNPTSPQGAARTAACPYCAISGEALHPEGVLRHVRARSWLLRELWLWCQLVHAGQSSDPSSTLYLPLRAASWPQRQPMTPNWATSTSWAMG